MADRIASFQRWAQREVERRHGVVDKFAGDAVMATFNVATPSLDHPVHALQAAMALRDKAALLGLPLGLGMAVGPAVVGRFAPGANLSMLGETTNAIRCEEAGPQAADPMQRVNALLVKLPANYRRVLELRFLEGASIKETASRLGTSVGYAKALQMRALRSVAGVEREQHSRSDSGSAVP